MCCVSLFLSVFVCVCVCCDSFGHLFMLVISPKEYANKSKKTRILELVEEIAPKPIF